MRTARFASTSSRRARSRPSALVTSSANALVSSCPSDASASPLRSRSSYAGFARRNRRSLPVPLCRSMAVVWRERLRLQCHGRDLSPFAASRSFFDRRVRRSHHRERLLAAAPKNPTVGDHSSRADVVAKGIANLWTAPRYRRVFGLRASLSTACSAHRSLAYNHVRVDRGRHSDSSCDHGAVANSK